MRPCPSSCYRRIGNGCLRVLWPLCLVAPRPPLPQLRHRERPTVPRIDHPAFKPLTLATLARAAATSSMIEPSAGSCVLQQVAAEQVAPGGQDRDRPLRVAGDREHGGVDAVGRQVVAFPEQQVRNEPLRLPEPDDLGDQPRTRALDRLRLKNMSPCSAMPASSRCMASLAPMAARRKAALPVWSKSPWVSTISFRVPGSSPAAPVAFKQATRAAGRRYRSGQSRSRRAAGSS